MPIPTQNVDWYQENVVLNTTLAGREPLFVNWQDGNGNELTDGTEYALYTDLSVSQGPYTITLTIRRIHMLTPLSFIVTVTPAAPCDPEMRLSQAVTLTRTKLSEQVFYLCSPGQGVSDDGNYCSKLCSLFCTYQ